MEDLIEEFVEWRRIYLKYDKIYRTDYFVSNDGYVKNNDGYILKPSMDSDGYLCIHISLPNTFPKIRKFPKVHRLVANAFIPNPENKPQVNHINGIKTDNRVENLEWVTVSENMQHAFASGLSKAVHGVDHRWAKHSEETILKACKLLMENNLTLSEISNITRIENSDLCNIRKHKIWKHIGKNFDFPSAKVFRYPKELKNSIIDLLLQNKKRKEIIEILGLEKTKKLKGLITDTKKQLKKYLKKEVQRLSKADENPYDLYDDMEEVFFDKWNL